MNRISSFVDRKLVLLDGEARLWDWGVFGKPAPLSAEIAIHVPIVLIAPIQPLFRPILRITELTHFG